MLDPVKDYLPEFGDPRGKSEVHGEPSQPATSTNLLQFIICSPILPRSSTKRLESQSEKSINEPLWKMPESLPEMVDRLARLPLKRQPGKMFEYGYSTDVLARIIEVVSGQQLNVYLREQILDPLGMQDSDFAVPESNRLRLAKVYEHGKNGGSQGCAIPAGEVREGVRKYPAGRALVESRHSTTSGALARCSATVVSWKACKSWQAGKRSNT